MSENAKKTILLVEDDAIIAMASKRQLEQYGYTVKTAATGEKAVEAVNSSPGIDLILMDIDLGKGIDGTQASEIILEDHDIPIVFVSNHTEPEIVVKTENITSYGYVVKATGITVLDASIKMAFKLFDAKKVQRKLEEELSYSKILMQAAFDQSPIAMAVTTYPDYTFKIINKAAEELLLISAKDFINKNVQEAKITWKDCYENGDLIPFSELPMPASLQGIKKNNMEIYVERHDGSRRIELISGAPIYAEDGKLLAGIIAMTDITEKKNAEAVLQIKNEEYEVINEELRSTTEELQAQNEELKVTENSLRANESKWSSLMDSMPDYISILDSDNRILFLNHYAEGFSENDVIGKSVFGFFPTESREIFRNGLVKCRDTKIIQKLEHTAMGDNGSIREYEDYIAWLPNDNDDSTIMIVSRDITERKIAENVFQKNEERYRTILQTAMDGYWLTDTQGNILDVNESYCKMCGYCRQELLGMRIADIAVPESAVEIIKRIQRVIKNGSERFVSNHRRKDGSILNVEVSAQYLTIEGDRIVSFIRDITERMLAEEALRESEEKYRLLVENSHDIIFTFSLDGIFTYVSPAWTVFLGHDANEILGQHFQLFVHPDDIEKNTGWLQKMIETGQLQKGIEYRVKHKNGNWRWHTSNAISLRDKSGRVIGFEGIARDITEQKIAQDALRDSEINYFALFNTVKQAIYIQNPDLTFVDVNQGVVDMYGYEKDFFIGKTPEFLSAPNRNDLNQVSEYIRLAFDGHPQNFEFWGIKKDGTIFPKDVWTVKGKYFGKDVVITMATDIGERKEKEAALKESQERLQFALEGSGLGEWDWNLKTSKIKRNDRWAQMLGYTLEEINDNLQQGIDLQHPDDHEETWKAIQDHLSGLTDSYNILYRMRARDGKYKWIHDCGKIMERDEQGKPLRLCGTHADVTEQKEKEEEIKHLLIEKELILKEVHHRIKNNMSAIGSLLSIQAHAIKEPLAINALNDANRRIQSMGMLYDKLYLSFDFTEISIRDYLPDLVDEIIENFSNNQIVKVEKVIQDFILDAKRLQPLGIIINELLTNIMKYAFVGKASGLITVSATYLGGHVIIVVQDDGNGIPESVSFENLSGFGLQLVETLTQQMKGTIRIERGNGTKVVLEFDK